MSIHNLDLDTLTLGKFRPSKNIDGTENWKVTGSFTDQKCKYLQKHGDYLYLREEGGLWYAEK